MSTDEIVIKSKVVIATISETCVRSHTSPPVSSRYLPPHTSAADDGGAKNNRRQSSKRLSRKKHANNDAETITLQETAEKRPVTLKASFLRKKAKEYEGN